jgi:glycosyltransferase involved in cell wall biosynthesis
MPRKIAKKVDLTIVIPVYNEAESLPHFLPELIKECRAKKWRLILVNDGSRDNSAKIISSISHHSFVSIITHKLNKGYGGALKAGLRETQTEFVITMDGDGQHFLSNVSLIFDYARTKDADMVVGSREGAAHKDAYRELGKWIIRTFTGVLVPLPIKDLNSGFKLYRTELVQNYLHLCPDSMAFSDVITLIFLHQRHLVLEHPIQIQKRIGGTSSINTQTAFQTIVEILNITMLINPLRIFLPLSFFSVLAGLIWGIPIMLLGRGVSVGSMLAIVVGALFFFLGLIASQLSSIRLNSIHPPKR